MCQALVNKMVGEAISNTEVGNLITKYFPSKRKISEEETEINVDCNKKRKLCHGVEVHLYESELSVEKNNREESKQTSQNVVFNNSCLGQASMNTVEFRTKKIIEKDKKKSIKLKLPKSTNNSVGKNRARNRKTIIPKEKITKYFQKKNGGRLTPSKYKLSPSLLGRDVTWGGGEQILICGGGESTTGVVFGGGEVRIQARQGVGEDNSSTNTFHFQPRLQTNLSGVEAEVKAGRQNTNAVEFLFYTDEEPSA